MNRRSQLPTALGAPSTNHKPITSWDNRDEAWTNVVDGLTMTVEAALKRVQQNIRQAETQQTQTRFGLASTFVGRTPEEAERRREVSDFLAGRSSGAEVVRQTRERIALMQQQMREKVAQQNESAKKWDGLIKGN
jgi:hypothetical protein